ARVFAPIGVTAMTRHRRALVSKLRRSRLTSTPAGSRRLGFEFLERRTLLALNVGMNLNFINYYSTQDMFANVMEMAHVSWNIGAIPSSGFPQNAPGATLPPIDQNDYPIGLGNLPSQGLGVFTFVYTHNGSHYDTGTYTLTFDGKGTVDVLNGFQVGQLFTQNGGTGSPFNVNITETNDTGIVIAITSSDATDYVRNIRLVRPGLQGTYQTNPYAPAFTNTFAPFGTIRFMDAMLPDFY